MPDDPTPDSDIEIGVTGSRKGPGASGVGKIANPIKVPHIGPSDYGKMTSGKVDPWRVRQSTDDQNKYP